MTWGCRTHLTLRVCMLSCFGCVQLFATLWTVARQAPLPMGFSRQETGVGCHTLLQGIFPTQGSNLHILCFLYWQVGALPLTSHGLGLLEPSHFIAWLVWPSPAPPWFSTLDMCSKYTEVHSVTTELKQVMILRVTFYPWLTKCLKTWAWRRVCCCFSDSAGFVWVVERRVLCAAGCEWGLPWPLSFPGNFFRKPRPENGSYFPWDQI